MLEEIKYIKSRNSDLRKFGITIGIILFIISVFLFWKEKESFQIFIATGIILLLTGIAIPITLKPIYWIWMIFAAILGWFMTRVILSILFYVIFTLIGLTARLFGKQFLDLQWDKSKISYWNYKTTENNSDKDYTKQF